MRSGTLVRYREGTDRAGEVYWVIAEAQPIGLVSLSVDGQVFDHATLTEWLEVIDLA